MMQVDYEPSEEGIIYMRAKGSKTKGIPLRLPEAQSRLFDMKQNPRFYSSEQVKDLEAAIQLVKEL